MLPSTTVQNVPHRTPNQGFRLPCRQVRGIVKPIVMMPGYQYNDWRQDNIVQPRGVVSKNVSEYSLHFHSHSVFFFDLMLCHATFIQGDGIRAFVYPFGWVLRIVHLTQRTAFLIEERSGRSWAATNGLGGLGSEEAETGKMVLFL